MMLLCMMLLCLSALAQEASGLLVLVRDPDSLLAGAPRVKVRDGYGNTTSIPVRDDGAQADMASSDEVWTGAGHNLVGPDYNVTLTDGARTWLATLTSPMPHAPTLSFQPTAEGGLVLVDAGPQVAAGEGAPTPPAPRGTPTAPATPGPTESGGPRVLSDSAPRLAAWLALLALLGWSVAGWRRVYVFPPPIAAPRPELPGRGVVAVAGNADALVVTLAQQFRVVLAGRPPRRAVPHGMVFCIGPGRVAVEDLLATVRGLGDRGPATVVVITSRLEAAGGLTHRATLAHLATLLPGDVNAYVFRGDAPLYEVSTEGALIPVEVTADPVRTTADPV